MHYVLACGLYCGVISISVCAARARTRVCVCVCVCVCGEREGVEKFFWKRVELPSFN